MVITLQVNILPASIRRAMTRLSFMGTQLKGFSLMSPDSII